MHLRFARRNRLRISFLDLKLENVSNHFRIKDGPIVAKD